MDLTEEDKNYILHQHIRLISCISDKEYQIRVWIKGIGPECHDFDENDPEAHIPLDEFIYRN